MSQIPKMVRFIDNDWWDVLATQFNQPYYQKLRQFLIYEYQHYAVYPNPNLIFEAFKQTPFSKVKVVILGQDPYPEPNTAMGLSFSVMPNRPIPRSLQNIYKELQNDVHTQPVNHGCLISWAQQGVLMLNSVLTVRNGAPGSHYGHGWENLTDYAIKQLSNRKRPVVFILWGRKAQAKLKYIDPTSNIIIESSHPSPLSVRYGFFGSKPFSKTNRALKALHEKPINWQLPINMTMDDLNQILK